MRARQSSGHNAIAYQQGDAEESQDRSLVISTHWTPGTGGAVIARESGERRSHGVAFSFSI
jgi:hypothetical protein